MTILKQIWTTLRYGLIFNELRYLLISIGIEISPFYCTEEIIGGHKPHEPKNGLKGYSFDFFGPNEIKETAKIAKNHHEDVLLKRLKEGKLCYGVKYNG